jgi:hypothetical protein
MLGFAADEASSGWLIRVQQANLNREFCAGVGGQ